MDTNKEAQRQQAQETIQERLVATRAKKALSRIKSYMRMVYEKVKMSKKGNYGRPHSGNDRRRSPYRPSELATHVQELSSGKDQYGGGKQETKASREDNTQRSKVIFHYWRPTRRMKVKWDGNSEDVHMVHCYVEAWTTYAPDEAMPHIIMMCYGKVTIEEGSLGFRKAVIE